jgi:hypothetical protein
MKFTISKTASLAGAQILLDLQKKALNLKEEVNKLKGPNNHEVEAALDDATSLLDQFMHHMIDIYGD